MSLSARIRRVGSVLMCLACSVSLAETQREQAGLPEALKYAVSAHRPPGAAVGVYVFDLTHQKEVFALQADEPFELASNTKLLTTAAALELLGPKFRFVTELLRTGKIDRAGVLRGDLVIKGGGDPNISGRFYGGLETWVLESWADRLVEDGVKRVLGDIVADDTIFDRQHVHPSWPQGQLAFWYCAPVSGLSFNDNCVKVTVAPGKPGELADVQVAPRTSYVKVVNQCITRAEADQPLVFSRPVGTNVVYVKGEIQVNSRPWEEWISVHEPALFLATVFREVLERKSILLEGRIRLADPGSKSRRGRLVSQYRSDLLTAIAVANKRSQNFYAEQIFKTLGRIEGGEASFDGGRRAVARFVTSTGFAEGSFQIRDGSGLARGNRCSPRQIVSLLKHMFEGRHRKEFISSLPAAGIEGSLEKRLAEEPYRGRIRAKTGYVSGVSALSGYVEGRSGVTFAFSVLVNRLEGGSTAAARETQDEVCRVLVDYLGE